MTSFGKHFASKSENALCKKEMVFKGNYYRISILSERLVRLEFSTSGKFNDNLTILAQNRNFNLPKFKVEEDERYLVITTSYFTLQYIKERPFKGPIFAPDSNLKVKLNGTDKLWYLDHPEARNFMANAKDLENFPKVDLQKGLYSTDGFVSVDDSDTLIINRDGLLQKNVEDKNNKDIYLFVYRRDFGFCLKDYYTLTGYPILLPRYAFGLWWNRDKIYNFNDTKNIILAFKKNGIPLSVLLLNEFWHIKDAHNYNLYKTGFTFNTDLFNDPKEFIDTMHQSNIHVGINIDPSEGVRSDEKGYLAMADDMGITNKSNIPFNAFDKMFIINYIDKLINPLMNMGVDFFWIDYKNDIRQLQALDYYHINNYKKDMNIRPMILTRNPLIAAHRCGIMYSGETEVSWDELKYLPSYNATSSNIGVSWWSHDVGGFKHGIEDSELYLRHIQFATFSPIFRLSAMRGNYYKREPWLWDIKTYTIVKYYCNLRQKLIPYLYSENYNYHKTGLPIVQPLYYNYPEIYDEPIYKNEYYFGSEFLIAPITKEKDIVMNRAVERIYLPEGIWYDFKTGKKFIGDKRYVTFFKDEDYPVFVKAGGIIPQTIQEDGNNDLQNPQNLEVHIFPGKNNVYNLYEDDGISRNYENGNYVITSFDYNYMANNYTLIIRTLEGKNELLSAKRNYKIRFRNTKEAENVEVFLNNDKASNKIEKYIDENDFVVIIYDVDTSKQLTINCKGKDIEIDAVRIVNEDINSIINDLKIKTELKELIADIIFSNDEINKKRIAIKKLKNKGLENNFIKMFIKLLEYIAEI